MSSYLLADIGGTHTRIALATPGGEPQQRHRYRNSELGDPLSGLQHFLAQVAPARPTTLAIAVAGPVQGGRVQLTNRSWMLHDGSLARALGLDAVHLYNDFQALARALPLLCASSVRPLAPGVAEPGAPRAVLGPGTGLGVAAAVPCPAGWSALACEGGHVTLAPGDVAESTLIDRLRQQLDHVSAEAVLCGAGLCRLHAVLHGAPCDDPKAITEAGRAGDPRATETIQRFFSLLGGFAGNLALTLGARGGLYLAGGMLPALWQPMQESAFLERFRAKGRFRDYLTAIPVLLIRDPEGATLLGLRALLDDAGGG
ncbi:ROK family protein [Alkalilimnicola ehrlichii MLHE-1]|uniref:Glucokinase n=1 Tax=Alkalilimnicola ehrlichii (strain ATCC BAA-1101 / DSM 17681 / MLHE-1) TaxID=187272 RepID=Q0ACS0_ALKEH|nr:glucokinase [Alkalilimnicola ehrlichii]ABI55367.1 glucokinase [Alkalilimnicola ehrlichii MLHE-1]